MLGSDAGPCQLPCPAAAWRASPLAISAVPANASVTHAQGVLVVSPPPGATVLRLSSVEGFPPGAVVRVGVGTPQEEQQIVRTVDAAAATVTLLGAIGNSHGRGAIVRVAPPPSRTPQSLSPSIDTALLTPWSPAGTDGADGADDGRSPHMDDSAAGLHEPFAAFAGDLLVQLRSEGRYALWALEGVGGSQPSPRAAERGGVSGFGPTPVAQGLLSGPPPSVGALPTLLYTGSASCGAVSEAAVSEAACDTYLHFEAHSGRC